MNIQESHLVCLTREQGHKSRFPTLWVGTGGAGRGEAQSRRLGSASCKGKGSVGPQPSCDAGIFGAQAMQIGTFVPPTHLLTKHPFPLSTEA